MKISSKLTRLIKQNDSFIIAGHINPEGDSIGTSLGIALGLKQLGKKNICVLSRDSVPENLRFLPSARVIKHKPPRKEYDVLLIVDCNSLERTGFKEIKARQTAIVDHHVLPDDASSSDFYKSLAASHIDPGAAATGVLAYKLLKALKVTIDKNIAANLYTAVHVDTGGFRYSNASPEALSTACSLVEAGAKPWEISKELYENSSFKRMKLMGLSLATLESKNGIAWVTTTLDMFRQTGTSSADCEDFVDFPRKVRGVEVAIFFREDVNDSIKISFRSKGKVDVQKITKSFGGGGHVAAAGCKITGTMEQAKSKVFKAVRKAIRETVSPGSKTQKRRK